jgi:hypothetical protein
MVSLGLIGLVLSIFLPEEPPLLRPYVLFVATLWLIGIAGFALAVARMLARGRTEK